MNAAWVSLAARGGRSARAARRVCRGAGLLVAIAAVIGGGVVWAADDGGHGATFTVYHDGKFAWPGDYSFVATPDYRDTSGAPAAGRYDIKVTLTGAWGGWQPFATNWVFDTTPYNYLTFAFKPTLANQTAQVYFMLVGDKPVGIGVDPFKYGPAPVVGQWGVYTIPLADIGVARTKIYKFAIQDKTGIKNNVFYVNDVAFLAEAPRP
jgi:hypothetical protein